jgi:hypothetical protein
MIGRSQILRRGPDGLPSEWLGPDPVEAHAPSTTGHTRERPADPLARDAALRKRILNDRLRLLGVTGSRRKPRLPPNATTRELRLAGILRLWDM